MAAHEDRSHNGRMLDVPVFTPQDLKGLSPEAMAKVADMLQHIGEQSKKIAEQVQAIKFKDVKTERIMFELARLKANRFGAKTERMNAEQRQMFEEAMAEDQASLQAQLQALQGDNHQASAPPADDKVKSKPRRQALPDHLRRVEYRHEPQNTSCECGRAMVRIGEDVSEKLDIVPAEFFVHRHIRGKWACKCCQTLVQEPVQPQVIDKGMPAAGLVAHTLVSRFVDHIPYYRQESINARSGVHTPRSTLAAWSGMGGAELQPLYDVHREFVLGTNILQADETPVNMLDPGAGKAKRAYIWGYARGAFDPLPGVAYDFCVGRGAKYPIAFLKDWSGTLVRDEYSAYNSVVKLHDRRAAGCLAHARRKYDELLKDKQSPVAAQAIGRIAWIYRIERELAQLTAEERLAAAGQSKTAVGGTADVADAGAPTRARRQRHCEGAGLQPESLGGVDGQPARWPSASGQQSSGKPDAPLGYGEKGLALLWQRNGGQTRRRRHEPGAVCETERPRPLGLPQGCADPAGDAPEQPH